MPIRHTIAAGECVSSVACDYGFFPDTIWKDAANAELKRLRKDPNTLRAGDVLVIPDKRTNTETKADKQRHRFRRKGVPEVLRIQFLVGGAARANEPYQLEVDGHILSSGDKSTDAEGYVEHPIPPGARRAIIRFGGGTEEYVFQLGRLEPVDTLPGLKGRLKCLGFFAGPEDDQATDELRAAVGEYQAQRGLSVTGEPDAATRQQIETECGG
jgi:hypothetical protein